MQNSNLAAVGRYDPKKNPHKAEVETSRMGVVTVEAIDINDVTINFEMHDREFNINGFTKLLAEGTVYL